MQYLIFSSVWVFCGAVAFGMTPGKWSLLDMFMVLLLGPVGLGMILGQIFKEKVTNKPKNK